MERRDDLERMPSHEQHLADEQRAQRGPLRVDAEETGILQGTPIKTGAGGAETEQLFTENISNSEVPKYGMCSHIVYWHSIAG